MADLGSAEHDRDGPVVDELDRHRAPNTPVATSTHAAARLEQSARRAARASSGRAAPEKLGRLPPSRIEPTRRVPRRARCDRRQEAVRSRQMRNSIGQRSKRADHTSAPWHRASDARRSERALTRPRPHFVAACEIAERATPIAPRAGGSCAGIWDTRPHASARVAVLGASTRSQVLSTRARATPVSSWAGYRCTPRTGGCFEASGRVRAYAFFCVTRR